MLNDKEIEKMKKSRPLEESYPTVVLQFKSAGIGGMPPDMEKTPAELVSLIAVAVADICESQQVDCEVMYGMTSVAKANKLGQEMANDERPPF